MDNEATLCRAHTCSLGVVPGRSCGSCYPGDLQAHSSGLGFCSCRKGQCWKETDWQWRRWTWGRADTLAYNQEPPFIVAFSLGPELALEMKKVIKWKWSALVRPGTGGEGCWQQWASDKDLSHLCLSHSQRVHSPFTAGNNCQVGNNREKEWVHLPSQGVSLAGLYSLCLFLLPKH